MTAYFDNSATTAMCSSAKSELIKSIEDNWGNPSSLHEKGIDASILLSNAQNSLSQKLSCKPDEIIFTSGGTQSNNIAIFGAVESKKRFGKKIITTEIEHSSVLECFKLLETKGFDVAYISCDTHGNLDLAQLENELDESVIFVSCMLVNNEIGSVLDVKAVSNLIRTKAKNALFHVDAVQGFGKMQISLRQFDIDLMSVSAHKVHGAKGAGALYVKNGAKIKQTFFGGEQGKHIRPGTEPMPAIAAFYGAMLDMDIAKDSQKVKALNVYLREKLSEIPEVKINSDENASAYVLNVSIEKRRSETVLNFLSDMGIFVSSGSACAKGHKSHVLTAMKLDDNIIDSSIRISLCRYNTNEEIDFLIQNIKMAIKVIRAK